MVFVVEQHCAYQEVDELDKTACHLLGWQNGRLMAYARLLPPDTNSHAPRIGRVLVHPEQRGKKIGQAIVLKAIDWCQQSFPGQSIKISAQSHLKKFYENLGFVAVGEEYLEDQIPHLAMIFPQSHPVPKLCQ